MFIRRQAPLLRLRGGLRRVQRHQPLAAENQLVPLLQALGGASDTEGVFVALQAHLPALLEHDWAALVVPPGLGQSFRWFTSQSCVESLEIPDIWTALSDCKHPVFQPSLNGLEARKQEILRGLAIQTGRCVLLPIAYGSDLAFLCLGFHAAGPWSSAERLQLTAYAAAVGLALGRVAVAARRNPGGEQVTVAAAPKLPATSGRAIEVQRWQELEIVCQMAIEINGQHDLATVLQAIADRACLLLNADTASIYLLLPNGREAELRVAVNLPAALIGTRIAVGQGLVGRVLELQQSLRIERYSDWPERDNAYAFAEFGVVLAVPLVTQQQPIGTLAVAHIGTRKQLSQADQRLLELLAAQAAQAIATAQLLEHVKRRTVEMEALYANAMAVSAHQQLAQVLTSIAQRALMLMHADNAGIHLVDHDRGELVLTVTVNAPQELVGTRIKIGEGVAGRVAQWGQSINLDDYQQWTLRADAYSAMLWRAVLCVPLRSGEQVVGVLGLGCTTPDTRFTAQDQQLLELFASQGAQAVEHAQRFERERVLRADAEGSLAEIKAVLEELQRTHEQMARIQKLRILGELASEVAHDFNNALVGILGNTQLLLLDETDPERVAMLRAVEAAAQDSAAMIKRIREFGGVQSGTPIERVDVSVLVQDALTMTQARWRERLTPQTLFQSARLVPGNPTELRRVLMNLIVNALDAMPQGGSLEITTRDQADLVCIDVADSGIGMPQHVLARIFDPFFTTKAAGMGTGLGLPICQQIITQHHGTITVDSVVNAGTRFTIQLPAVDAEAAVAPTSLALACAADDPVPDEGADSM